MESPSDSEFELTLDDSGGLAPAEDAPQVKAGQDKDIFETDFEVPALEEESGSQVAALDTDLDSSDFDLALGDSEVAAEEGSGSQVVALDEEEADEAAATVAAKRGALAEAEGEAAVTSTAGGLGGGGSVRATRMKWLGRSLPLLDRPNGRRSRRSHITPRAP